MYCSIPNSTTSQANLSAVWRPHLYLEWHISREKKITYNRGLSATLHVMSEFYVYLTVHRNEFVYNKTNQMHQFHKCILSWNSTCFRQFVYPSSGVYTLYTQQCYMSYRFVDSLRAVPSWSCSKAVYKPVWHIPLLSVQWINSWWLTDELCETFRVSWQNKFVKLVHLVGFIIKKIVMSDLRPSELRCIEMGHTSLTKREVFFFDLSPSLSKMLPYKLSVSKSGVV
jgi:hypothetical protein